MSPYIRRIFQVKMITYKAKKILFSAKNFVAMRWFNPSHKFGKYTNILPQNFTPKILWYSGLVLHVILENNSTPSCILLDALKYKVFAYIFSMVICTYSVHITIRNILLNFETKTYLGTAKLLQYMLRIIWSIRSSLLNDL